MTFRFAHPAALMLMILPLIMVFLYIVNRRRFEAPVMRYSDTRLLDGLPVTWRIRLRRAPDGLRLVAWVLLIFALARPQSGRSQEVIRGQGIDIVLALDVSTSMRALDFEPKNRLESAKEVISDFINGRTFDRIGLIVFAQDAFQHVPPTLDYTVLLRALDQVQMADALGIEDGTAIGSGIASAANMMRTSQAPSKVIILLTDGANNAGALDPVTAAQAVAALGIKVYTVGVGRTGQIPVPDDEGNIFFTESDLDEPTLQTIADTTEAVYFRAEDLPDLQQIYNQIDSLERTTVERQVFIRWRERAGLLMTAGLLLLIAERGLRHTAFQSLP